MRRKHIFTIVMLLSCVLLFLQRFTGMGIHAILGLVVLIVSIGHTVRRRNVWRSYGIYQKVIGTLLWLALAGVVVTGFLLKPLSDLMFVIVAHKMSAVAMVVFLILHVRIHNQKKIRKSNACSKHKK